MAQDRWRLSNATDLQHTNDRDGRHADNADVLDGGDGDTPRQDDPQSVAQDSGGAVAPVPPTLPSQGGAGTLPPSDVVAPKQSQRPDTQLPGKVATVDLDRIIEASKRRVADQDAKNRNQPLLTGVFPPISSKPPAVPAKEEVKQPQREPQKEQVKEPQQSTKAKEAEQLLAAAKSRLLPAVQAAYSGFELSTEFLDRIVTLEVLSSEVKASNLSPEAVRLAGKLAEEPVAFALNEMLTSHSLSIVQIATLAHDIRTLAAETFDAWVESRMRGAMLLGAMNAFRSFGFEDMQKPGKLQEGNPLMGPLVLGLPDAYIRNFVAIIHETMAAELHLKGPSEIVELDVAFTDFINARKIAMHAEEFIRTGNTEQEILKGTRLLREAQKFDESAMRKLEALRARHGIKRPEAPKDVSSSPAAEVKEGAGTKTTATGKGGYDVLL